MLENIEAEQGVLGCILYEPDLIKDCRLSAEHFSEAHRPLFQAICNVDKRGDRADLLTVTAELKKQKYEDKAGYLADLMNSVASLASFKGYQRMIFEAYRLRETHRITSEFAIAPDEDKITDMYQKIGELQEIGVEDKDTKQDTLVEIYEDMETDRGEIAGIDTGYYDLNELTGGLQNSELTVVAARPSVGKTAFALNLALNTAYKHTVVDLFSLEMPEKQLTHRFLSAIGNVDLAKWKNPYRRFTDADREKISKAIGIYNDMNIYIHDHSRQTVADIRAHVRKTRKNHPGEKHLVIVDYLTLLTPQKYRENRNLEVAEMTRELKNLAGENDIPVVLLSQLSRGIESRKDKRPMLSDLRDSGAVEQDANNVIFLHRDDYYGNGNDNIIQLIIAKQRNGPVGTVELAFLKEHGRFVNLDKKHWG